MPKDDPQLTPDAQAIEPYYHPPRSGFDLFVNQCGEVCIQQDRPFKGVETVILHPDEARALLDELPAHIKASES